MTKNTTEQNDKLTKNILIVGVGGQGTLLASRILGAVFADCGHDVKVSEVHGMSQRGGSVVTHVRYGKSVASPIVEKGQADVILAFEKLEALRYVSFAAKDCLMIVNNQELNPMPVIAGATTYPQGIFEEIKRCGVEPIVIDAKQGAIKAGSAKAVNLVIIGKFAKRSGIGKQIFVSAIKNLVPEKMLELNLKAFEAGYACIPVADAK